MQKKLRPTAALGVVLLCGCSQEFRTAAGDGSDAGVVKRTAPFGEIVLSNPKSSGALEVDASDAQPTVLPKSPVRAPTPSATTPATEVPPNAQDAGTNADAATGAKTEDAAPTHACAGSAGPKMVSISTATGSSYCIDATEVTVSDYAAFLASNPAVALAPSTVCSWKQSFVPAGTFPPSGSGELPVSSVDWCDAAAYCAFAGKHLCGKTGGGANPYTDFAKPTGEWYFACTQGGKTTLPYGSTFDPSACVGVDFDGVSGFQPGTDAPHAVATATRCHGAAAPFDALHDMAGNVAEWEDSCDSTGGSADYCHLRGDSYREGNASTMSCGYAPRMTRSYRAGYIGFRCCL